MAFPAPPIDPRTFREVLDEALARVPVHNPEWTNLNDADPGVTLLQLFAFMTESIIYRTNRIPERNRAKFLRLLGVPLRAAAAARGLVSFSNPKGELPVTLAADQELFAGPVPFRTENGLQILPIEARVYYKKPLDDARRAEIEKLYRRLYASFEDVTHELAFYETLAFTPPEAGIVLQALSLADTIDGSLWLALLARPKEAPERARERIAGQSLTLGILPALGEDGCVLLPEGASERDRPRLIFEIPNPDETTARYRELVPSAGGDALRGPGIVTLNLPETEKLHSWEDLDPQEAGTGNYPPSLEESEDQARLITWLRVRTPEATAGAGASRQVDIRISWFGINAARVIQRARVPAETLPDGTGEPEQTVGLVNTPVIVESVRLTVNGEIWQPIDDLAAAPPEVQTRAARRAGNGTAARAPDPDAAKVYTVDRQSGEIRFGTGLAGMRPPRGAAIQAAYDHGGGREGMVGIGAINKGDLPAGIKVTNPVPTWGGDRAETVAEAELRVPRVLRDRDRIISAEDLRLRALEAPGVEIGRAEALPLFHPELPAQVSPGVVAVLVIPRTDPVQPAAPRPDRLFLEAVCAHLAPRRVLTTELHVRGPAYVPVWLTLGIEVVPGADDGPVREEVRLAIERFLSPLHGGFEGKGWPLAKPVEVLEILTVATRVAGVAKINRVRLGDGEGAPRERIPLAGLELPRLMAVAVAPGDAPGLDELVGGIEPPPPGDGERAVVPVPVVPEEC